MNIKYVLINKPNKLNFKNKLIDINGKYDIINILERKYIKRSLNLQEIESDFIEKIDKYTFKLTTNVGIFYIYITPSTKIRY